MRKGALLLVCGVWSLFSAGQNNTFSFTINGTPPIGFKEALEIAGENWSRFLEIRIPVKVNVFLVNTNLVPASAITLSNGRQNFPNAPVNNVLYPTALANQLAGIETNPGEYDMDIYFNLYTSFYYGTGNPPSNQQDLITTAMHEIGHGLGFYSDAYVDASNIGSFGNIPPSALFPLSTSFPWRGQDSVPSIFDLHITRYTGTPLWGCAPEHSQALGDSIKLQPSYFTGTLYANASHSNTPIRLSGGQGFFSLGTDLLHIHYSYENTIMSYGWGAGDTVRTPAPFEIGILKELGWKQTTAGIKDHAVQKHVTVQPNPATSFIEVEGKNITACILFDIHGQTILHQNNDLHRKAFAIDVSKCEKGIYFLRVQISNGKALTRKVIVE